MKFSVAVAGLALVVAFANAQQVTYPGYIDPHQELLNPYNCEAGNQDEWVCGFSQVLASQPGKPSIADYLAMFSDRYVENNGKIYAVKNSQGNGALADTYYRYHMEDGLYEVSIPDHPDDCLTCSYLGGDGNCVVFKLLIEAQDIGQIIAAPARFDPIQVIGVDQETNKIWGYYPTASGGWTRKQTVWGDAKDGSMRSYDWEVIGLSTNDRMFNLWGDFNYAKHDDIKCSATPSAIDEWSDYDGIYCPADDNQLWKNTWRGGWAKEKLIWASASTITRFDSGICGITTDGKLLILWNDSGTIRSAPLDLHNIYGVRAVGGLEDTSVWGSGVLLTNGYDEVYTVWWDGSWKEKEITIDKRFKGRGKVSVLFGNHNGEMYMLYGWYDVAPYMTDHCYYHCEFFYDWSNYCYECSLHEVYLYHMKFVGGSQRYQAIRIQGDTDV